MNIFKIGIIALLAFSCMQANASSITISPTSLRTTDSSKAQALTLTNKGSKPTTYHVQIYAWSLVDGKDVLVPTTDVIASPRIVEIAPNSKQVIRIVKPVPSIGKATYYRVFARELPAPPTPGKSGISNPIYHNLPASFEPANAAPFMLTVKRQGNELAVTNTGGKAARISQVATTTGTVLAEGALGWALPGSMKLVPAKGFTGSEVVLTVNGKPQTLSVN